MSRSLPNRRMKRILLLFQRYQHYYKVNSDTTVDPPISSPPKISRLDFISEPDVTFSTSKTEDLEVFARLSLQISLWVSLYLTLVNTLS